MGFQNLGVFNGDSHGLNSLSPNYQIIKIYVKKNRYFQIKKKKKRKNKQTNKQTHARKRGANMGQLYIEELHSQIV